MTTYSASALQGKVVTLPLGAVVTVVGVGRRNGREDEGLCVCLGDDGGEYAILSRVIAELPRTYRRAEIGGDLWKLVVKESV